MKEFSSLSSLARFGGPPAFDAPRFVGAPVTGNKERFLERLDGMFARNWLTNQGPLVEELEDRFAAICGVPHAVAFCNGTSALETLIRAMDLSGEIIVPSFTFIATAHAVHWMGLTPVFADIDPETCTLDPEAVARAITPRTSAILGVHLWGNRCRVEALQALADRHGLKLLFDAAHAFGCSWEEMPPGSVGDAEIFSLHATKILNGFEGGVVTTRDGALAERLRLMQNFGFSGYDTVACAGTNGKMIEAAAAMVLTNLDSVAGWIATNRKNYKAYARALSKFPGMQLLVSPAENGGNCQYVVASVDAAAFGLTRNQVVDLCHAENFIIRRYFYPGCHRMEPYHSLFPDAGESLPVTEDWCDRVLVLPTGPGMSQEDIELAGNFFRWCHDHAGEIAAKMATEAA